MLGKQVAIILVFALICVLALPPSLEATRHGGLDKKKQPRAITPEDVPIDAFDESICGKVSVWTKGRCIKGYPKGGGFENRNDTGRSRVVDGDDALRGEFPFAVKLILCTEDESCDLFGPGARQCGGVLVHKDLVITAASCFKPDSRNRQIVSASVQIHAHKHEPLYAEAKRWCWHVPSWTPSSDYELAVIKLKKPLDSYTPGKNGPACLRRSAHQKMFDPTCAIVGYGKTNGEHPGSNAEIFPLLQKAQVGDVRVCYRSVRKAPQEVCYKSRRGLACGMDLGGPVACYDSCADSLDKVRVYAYGVMSRWNDNCEPNKKKNYTETPMELGEGTWAIDFYYYHHMLMDLLEVTHKDKERSDSVMCRNAQERKKLWS